MALQICRSREPSYTIVMDGMPKTDVVEDVLYIPEGGNALGPDTWGVFGRDRRLVASTAMFRGPGPHLPHQRYTTGLDVRDVTEHAPEQAYIYGGRMIPHYGHFLVGCLPRFWQQKDLAGRKLKILIHSPHDVAHLFSHAHVVDLFAAIGLSEQDFVVFTEPVRISCLIVPWPSFEEGHLAYPLFADFCHDIARTLLGPAPAGSDDRPLYFTKQFVPGGIARFTNESELTDVLRRHGVEIVSAEAITVAEQVRLFSNRSMITGSFGSVFHTSIFVPRRRLAMLNWTDAVFSNFTLVDTINDNDTHYVHPKDDIDFQGEMAGFGATWRLVDPVRTAEQFLTVLDAFSGAPSRGRTGGLNLSLRKPTLQSSYAHQPGVVHTSGVEGRISGGATFHTGHEERPWWQVDLEQDAMLTRVVLFNVVGPLIVTERSALFRILVSVNGFDWQETFRRTDPTPIGGIDSAPFEWEPEQPVKARLVRVQLLESEFFHLDQVQVFGWPVEDQQPASSPLWSRASTADTPMVVDR